MSPQIVRTDTGRIIAVANNLASGYSSDSVIDQVTGKVFLVGSKVGGDIDTWVSLLDPNTNYYTYSNLEVGASPLYGGDFYRTYIKCPINKILHLHFGSGGLNANVDVVEVDPNDFNITTITWNTQPSLGSVIYTFLPTRVSPRWSEMPTGTSGAICLKPSNSSVPGLNGFDSTSSVIVANRPYFTDP